MHSKCTNQCGNFIHLIIIKCNRKSINLTDLYCQSTEIIDCFKSLLSLNHFGIDALSLNNTPIEIIRSTTSITAMHTSNQV